MSPATITLLFLLFAIVMFVWEKIPLGVTSMIICVGLVVTGVLDWKTAFAGFIDSNVILFVAMFIVGGALFETGMANKIGGVVTHFAKTERQLIIAIMIIVGLMSGVLSNTGTAAVLIPVLSWLTQMLNIKLMPTAATTQDGGANDQMNATMKSMNTFMPLFSAFICFSFPVGIGIYWIAGSVIRCIQQLIINKHLDNMDLEDYIRKNQAKAAKKREKSGLPPQKITQQAKQNVRNIEEPKCTTNLKKYNNNSGSKAVDTYREVPETKPGSLASKANMVAEFDKKNKTKKK